MREAVPLLVKLSGSEDLPLGARHLALTSLGMIGGDEARGALVSLVHDVEARELRKSAAHALALLASRGDGYASEELVNLVASDESDAIMKVASVYGLALARDERSTEYVVGVLKSGHDVMLSRLAPALLVRAHREDLIGILEETASSHADEVTARNAVVALGKLWFMGLANREPTERYLRSLDSPSRPRLVRDRARELIREMSLESRLRKAMRPRRIDVSPPEKADEEVEYF